MVNYDETLLRSHRIQAAAPWPVQHQALRIALYDEYAAQAFYTRVIEAFGQHPPFDSVVLAEARHIEALGALCERYGVPRPINPYPAEATVAPTWRANLERAVAGEVANVQLYQYLLAFTVAIDVRQTFQSLQSASRDKHLPAFRKALESAVALETYHAQRGVAPTQAYASHGPLTDALERGLALLVRQSGAVGLASSLIRAAHPAMIAGLLVGGAAVHYLRHSTPQPSLSTTKEN